MSRFTRPTFNVDDDDLERLQQEFFEKETMPSAKVYRKSAPSMKDQQQQQQQPKKRSLFAERLHASSTSNTTTPSNMPALEDPISSKMPALKNTPMPALEKTTTTTIEEEKDEYEPVMDPNPEPHVPVSKKMIDLTSLLGQVLGEIKEHEIKEVQAPSLPTSIQEEGKPARGQQGGFPKPVHRSEFKKRLEAQRNKAATISKPRQDTPPQVSAAAAAASGSSALLDDSLYNDENDRRIGEMSEQELEEARQEILNTLSPESIAFLKKGGLANKKKVVEKDVEEKHVVEEEKKSNRRKVSFAEGVEDKDDLLQMKKQYFRDVPVENDKLAWMDNRFLTPEIRKQEALRLKELEHENNEAEASEAEKVYRKVRFDLQGRIIDTNKDIPRHQGLHHHGDEPEKAGYTLAELFYLARSQVPSQRSMVLTTLSRIITQAKLHKEQVVWSHVLTVFTGKEHAATIYLRSALDDRNLAVLVSAINALSALVLDQNDQEWEASLLDVGSFNQFLGHIARPVLPQGAAQIKRKGLNDKLSELVDRVRQTSGQQPLGGDEEQDAALAERDLVRGLIKMNILPRMRYLLGPESDLLQMDRTSVERLIRILVRMAESGQDVCEAIEQEEILELVVDWGIKNTCWPMISEQDKRLPSLASVRLLTVLAQGSKQLATEAILEKATITLHYLVTSPTVAHPHLKQRAYALQFETLKLIRVLACYGYIVPTLEDLHDPVMSWLRAALAQDCTTLDATRAATAMGLLEILLHVAADPHKSIPAHAIDWHQPTAYLPAITAVLRASRQNENQVVFESALGYLGAWASHLNTFPPAEGTDVVGDVWKAVVQEDTTFADVHSVALGYTTSTNHVLRYIQFIAAYTCLVGYQDLVQQDAKSQLRNAQLIHLLKQDYQKDMLSRYAFWLWCKTCQEKEKCWGMGLGLAELESGIKATNVVESWLAQDLVKLCLDNKTLGDLTNSLGPFYFQQDQTKLEISRALFEHDGRSLKTLMYTIEQQQQEEELSNMETTAFILSPIDALYHLDKSPMAQKSQHDAATLVANTMELATKLFYTTDIHHDVALITLMKIFLIGDREGRQAEMMSEREIFLDDRVSQDIGHWLDYLCKTTTTLTSLEVAWRRSSEYIRQAQVPFFQFYQGFVAQYASVSFGHHGFARLLVYLVTQIDTIDYRHLMLSDYREVLSTLKVVRLDQLPPLDSNDVKSLSSAGLNLS